MENDVVEHGESAEYKTQSLTDFYTAATKMIFEDWSFFNRSQTQSHKQQKYPRQRGCDNAPNLS